MPVEKKYDLLVKNVRLVRPNKTSVQKSDVAIKDGKFARIAREIPAEEARKVVEGKGLLAFPGIVDPHIHTGIYSPLAKDAVLSLLSLDYHMTLSAAAGEQLRENAHETMKKHKGNYILAVEGNPPLNEDGMYCIYYGKPFVEALKEYAKDAKAVVAWGSCASWGCVQAAKPNPTNAVPIDKVITDKPIIKVPGCPPIAEVMTAIVTYVLTFDRIPELDRQGRPKMFYSQRIHDKCYRRPHFDAGQFVEKFDDEGARAGYCLYKVGCKGPTTYNACSTTRWNEGVSFPIGSGHGCIGCSEDGFWDKGSFYDRLTSIPAFGVEANADKIGAIAAGVVGAAVVAHAAVTAIKSASEKK